ncbi:hypothetical protein CTO_0996 [Chlamydia trachomatis A2497]|uniref:Uncharacterized protein n=1 Tax=Chlamydia trachomatis serovar A (strain A2497) TaxID=580047 RepID=G4NN38_CHLT4|nr:hypothetical protein CTO_0996 [Chlamydia trachomatis A2497]
MSSITQGPAIKSILFSGNIKGYPFLEWNCAFSQSS